jgi:small subunit ribosomal protein S20
MPIIKSAKKAMRSSARKRVFNERRKKVMRDAVKDIKNLAVKDSKSARENLAKAYQAIDKAAKRGVIKKNAAARKKSRLAKLIKKNSK